jgi:hypothetical protein
LAVLFAVDLRAVVRFAAAGATSCPQPFLGNGTVLTAMLTPLARAFPHLRRVCFACRACAHGVRSACCGRPRSRRTRNSLALQRKLNRQRCASACTHEVSSLLSRRKKKFAKTRASAADRRNVTRCVTR